MKKRIISLILTVAMLVLMLVGCAYNYSKDDLSQYATFDKAGFEAAIKKLEIKDGDFSVNEETRAKKVLDAMYQALAKGADTTATVTEGKVGAHDLLYYCYYITAEIGGKTVYFVGDEMTTAKAKSVQMGLQFPSDLEAAILAAAIDLDITDKAYSQVKEDDESTAEVNESKAKEGQVAYISYSYSYTETDANGVEKEIKGTVTKHRVVLDKSNIIHAKLLADSAKIGATVADFKDDKGTEDAKDDISYTKAKIEWVEKGSELTTFTETYEGTTDMTDTEGTKHLSKDLKDNKVQLTYHVYPVHFVAVDALTATNVINVVYGKNITFSVVKNILFGSDFSEKTEDEQKALLDEYKTSKDNKELSLEDFVTNLANLQNDYTTNKTAYDKAVTAKEKADKDLADAKQAVADAGDKATEAQKSKVTTAENALKVAEEDLTKAKTKYDDALKARDEKVTELLKMKTDMETKITTGYEKVTYKGLEDTYNTEIKTALATEVYKLIEKYVTVNSVPEKAVDEAYDQLIENFQSDFYNNETLTGDSAESNKDQSYYSIYKGSFKNFLIKCVVPNEYKKTVSTYDEAKAAVRDAATELVKPVLRVYVVADAFDLTIDDKEFKERAENDINYTYNEGNHGENTVRNAYQFDDVMNYVLESETKDGKVTYKKVVFTFKAEDAEAAK